MNTKALLLFTGFLTGVAVAVSIPSRAQPYVGGSIGRAYQYGIGDQPSDHSACFSTVSRQAFPVGALFAGYRAKYVGAEIGAGSLFSSYFGGDCPWSRGSQSIDASYRYLRINAYVPMPYGLELVPFVGKASVKFTNYEVQDYRAPTYTPEHVTNLTTGKQVSTLLGAGLQKGFDKWFVRGEYQRVNRAAEDYWTARGWHNTVQTLSVAIGRHF